MSRGALFLLLVAAGATAESFRERYPLANDDTGPRLWREERYEELWQSFDAIPEADRNPRWYHDIGSLRISLHELDAAGRIVAAGLSRYPREGQLWRLQSRLQRRAGDLAGSLHSLDRAEERLQGDEEALAWCSNDRAWSLAGLGRHDRARALYDSLVTARPDDVRLLLNSMGIEAALGNLGACRQRFRRADSLGVSQYGRAYGYSSLAYAALWAGKPEPSQRYLEELEVENNDRWYDEIAALNFLHGRADTARIEALESAQAHRVDRAALAVHVAGLRALAGDDRALTALADSSAHLGRHQRRILAFVLAQLGWPQAREVAEALYRVEPHDSWLNYGMARILENRGDPGYRAYHEVAVKGLPGNEWVRRLGDLPEPPSRSPSEEALFAHELQPPYYAASLIREATFEPNVVTVDRQTLPPLFVRASGAVGSVTAQVPDPRGGEPTSYALRDDGRDGDAAAGDGIFTLDGVAADLRAYPTTRPAYVSRFGWPARAINVRVETESEDSTQTIVHARLGFVHDAGLSMRAIVDEGVQATSHVVSMVDDGTLFTSRGSPPIDVHRVARRFYRYYEDDYDFLIVRSALELIGDAHGVHRRVRNDIDGIGVEVFDNSSCCGHTRRLKGIMYINFSLMGATLHELAHQWANRLESFAGSRGHWHYSDVDGILGGLSTQIVDLGDDRFLMSANPEASAWCGKYAPLELYLMGLVPPAAVPPTRVLRGVEGVTYSAHEGGWVVSAESLQTVTIDDIIGQEGPRVPDHASSQKTFRAATIVVSPEPLDPIALTYFDRQAQFLAADQDDECTFAGATGGRASLETRLRLGQ
jgi:tetratricopeptide (TPR) repeat protein